MILGLDTKGRVYLSLVQANSDSKVMEVYFHALVKKLTEERPNWRKDTVVLLDNARYHSCRNTRDILEKLAVPAIFTGPHSYNAAACELYFAAFKKEDINPRKIKTGKR